MEEHVEMFGDVAVFRFPGEYLNASNARAFKSDIQSVLAGRRKVVFDLSNMTFIDSMGLAALLSCLRQLNHNEGDLKLCGMNGSVRSVFELVRFHKVLDLLNDREEAVQAFD